MDFSSVKQDLFSAICAQQTGMVEQLYRLCEINTGTDNLAGLARMHEELCALFMPLADGIATQSFPAVMTMTMQGQPSFQTYGNALFIRKRPELPRRVLLVGHMDTVYGVNHPFQTVTPVNDNTVRGPGVSDMKGGLIVMLHALSTFEQSPQSQALGWDVFINADEEIGSLASSRFYEEIAPNYELALVYEPAMDKEGTFAKHRSGSGKLTVIATGKTAHAGRAFDEGRNAICYLAEAITAIDALNGLKEGVTINVGKIAGGTALNVVPDVAVAKLDVRIKETSDASWVMEHIDGIFQRLKRPDYALSLHGGFHRPVKTVNPATERLFARIQRMGREMGLTLTWQNSGGCCDGNNLAAHGMAVIDTLGVRGGRIHSEEEFIKLDSLVERTTLSTLLLMDIAEHGFKEQKG